MTSVLTVSSSPGPRPKVHVSSGALPPFIDLKQAPTRKSPWRQIREIPFISSVTLTLPERFYTTILQRENSYQSTSSLSSSPLSSLPLPSSSPSSSSLVAAAASDLQSQFHIPPNQFAKVILTLKDIITGDFFTTYIKSGNILMLSEGIPGVSNWLGQLVDGRLRMEMAREVYEQCGLQGVPADRNGGARKHTRGRWIVDIDLRAPAMVRGRKGFERLVRAAEGLLVDGKVWLFRNFNDKVSTAASGSTSENNTKKRKRHSESDGVDVDNDNDNEDNDGNDDDQKSKGGNVIDMFHPTTVSMQPSVCEMTEVRMPAALTKNARDTRRHKSALQAASKTQDSASPLQPSQPPLTNLYDKVDKEVDEEAFYALTEWLDLVHLQSPRIIASDNPDPYISRYSVDDVHDNHGRHSSTENLVSVTWRGLLDRQWCISLLIHLIRASRKLESSSSSLKKEKKNNDDINNSNEKSWLALTIKSHRTEAMGHIDGCTIFLWPGHYSSQSQSQSQSCSDVDGGDDDDDDTADADAEPKNDNMTTGLYRFTCFQFVDTTLS